MYDSTRHTGKTKESSVNWSFPDQHSVEVLDGTKGKLDGYVTQPNHTLFINSFGLFACYCPLNNVLFKECVAALQCFCLSLVANSNCINKSILCPSTH